MISNHLNFIWEILPNARLVGGCVRDSLLGKTPKDYDFATDLLPEEVTKLFEENNIEVVPSGLQHGTVMVILDGVGYEITTLRTDDETDGRHATVSFTKSWEIDAGRRDFTFNALYMDKDNNIYDYYNGVNDLKNNTIRFIGRAEDRIKEDALRILRYFRFMTRIDNPVTIEQDIIDIKNNIDLLDILSKERILSELTKIFSCAKTQWNIFSMMNEYGISKKLFNKEISIINKHIDINYLTIFSMIADDVDYMFKFKGSNQENSFVNNVVYNIKNNIVIDNEYELKVLLLDFSKNEIKSKMFLLLNNLGYIDGDKWNNFVEKLNNTETPVFPLRGQDFVDLGFKGVEIGIKMKKLKNLWIEHKFTDTKETLLKNIME